MLYMNTHTHKGRMMSKVLKNQETIFKGNTNDCLDFISKNKHSALSMVLVLEEERREKTELQLDHERKIFNE